MAVWTTSTYKHLDTKTGFRNMRHSIARNGTTVLFKSAYDGETWDTDINAVTVGDLGSSDKTCTIEIRSDGLLIVGNGKDKEWYSTNTGVTWTAST